MAVPPSELGLDRGHVATMTPGADVGGFRCGMSPTWWNAGNSITALAPTALAQFPDAERSTGVLLVIRCDVSPKAADPCGQGGIMGRMPTILCGSTAFSDEEMAHGVANLHGAKGATVSVGVMAEGISPVGPTTMSKPRSVVVTMRPCKDVRGESDPGHRSDEFCD